MKYDVFISYSSKDALSAKRICTLCENSGIKCFLAERDIPRGQLWAPHIVDAISMSSVMVALFSSNYNLSEEVDREITLASIQHMPILVYRIDMSEFKGAKAYYFSNLNWFSSLDAEKSGDQDFILSIRALLKRNNRETTLPISDDVNESQLIAPSITAAKQGDPEAQFYLGRYYEGKKNLEQAIFWYRKAAELGVAAASYNISMTIFLHGIQEEYPNEAFINAERAYNGGIHYAGVLLAWCYIYGRSVGQSYQKGWRYIAEFLNTPSEEPKSLGMAYYLLGNYYAFGWGETQKDIQKAIHYWKISADYNNPEAIYNLGASYLNGHGVDKNESRAYSYFQQGVELGDIKSYMGLARCYRLGIGVDKSIKKAVELYKHAAKSGEPEAYACLGVIFLCDIVPIQEAEAAQFFYEGSKLGNTTSQHYLGVMYFNGMGLPKNQTEGIKLLKLAAEKGNMDSIICLKKLGLI